MDDEILDVVAHGVEEIGLHLVAGAKVEQQRQRILSACETDGGGDVPDKTFHEEHRPLQPVCVFDAIRNRLRSDQLRQLLPRRIGVTMTLICRF